MIVTDHCVFLHLHKSGGTFVNEFLMRFVPEARQIGYHLPRKLAPPTAAQLQACSQQTGAYTSLLTKWAALKAKISPPAAPRAPAAH